MMARRFPLSPSLGSVTSNDTLSRLLAHLVRSGSRADLAQVHERCVANVQNDPEANLEQPAPALKTFTCEGVGLHVARAEGGPAKLTQFVTRDPPFVTGRGPSVTQRETPMAGRAKV